MKNDSLNIHRRIGKPNANNDANIANLPILPDTSSAENMSEKTASTEELPAGKEPSPALDRCTYSQSSYTPVQDGIMREPDPAYTYGTGVRKGSDRIAREPDPACTYGTKARKDSEGIVREPNPAHTYGTGARKDLDGIVCEPGPAYNYGTGARKKTDGETPGRLYTLEDYLALPNDRRVELIDGVIYDMAAPSGIHQKIASRIWMQFELCIQEKDIPCNAQIAPFDVNLDKYTVVQPDVMVFCEDPSQALAIRATHAPDLVIEVLSPSTASRDRLLKLRKYRESGVKELWLVSPKSRQVEVYLFLEGEDTPRRYSFSDKVPVHISEDLPEGKCEVDFSVVTRGLPLP